MPQATSVQREPSMEEILASIRRIIEDSDSTKKHPSDGEERISTLESKPAEKEVESFRAELRTPPEPASMTPSKQPVSLADIQNEIRRGTSPQREVETTRPEPVAAVPETTDIRVPDVQPASKMHIAERAPVSMADIQAMLDKPVPEPSRSNWQPVESPQKDAVEKEEEIIAETASPASEPPVSLLASASEAAIASSDVSIERPVALRPHVEEAPRQTIISAAAGRQVAAAFGELSEVFAASRQKSFDQMAEEMMRPMLQEWMDNNLPTLVERLVREEIERVARGG